MLLVMTGTYRDRSTPGETPSRGQVGERSSGRRRATGTTLVELATDLGDVLEATPTGLGVEAELQRRIGRCENRVREQRQLAGDVVLVHVPHLEPGV
jgi:hypothetical protein